MARNRPDLETCARCGVEFSAAAHRAYPNAISEAFSVKWLTSKITDSALVACPSCGHRFPSNRVRFFGFLSLYQIRLVFLMYLASLLLVALFVAVRSW
jgi:DNA-directed RNA polymerase subunit RPC12/RpoP